MAYIKKKYQDRIEEMYKDEDGWWISLKRGWYWDDPGLHTIHEDTKAEALKMVTYTDKCTCRWCRGLED